jgi:hypothetical protein
MVGEPTLIPGSLLGRRAHCRSVLLQTIQIRSVITAGHDGAASADVGRVERSFAEPSLLRCGDRGLEEQRGHHVSLHHHRRATVMTDIEAVQATNRVPLPAPSRKLLIWTIHRDRAGTPP